MLVMQTRSGTNATTNEYEMMSVGHQSPTTPMTNAHCGLVNITKAHGGLANFTSAHRGLGNITNANRGFAVLTNVGDAD